MNEHQGSTPHEETRNVRIVTPIKPLTLGELELDCAVGECEDGTYVDLFLGKKLRQVFGDRNHGNHVDIDLLGSSPEDRKAHIPRFLAATSLREFLSSEMLPYFMPYTYKAHGITSYAYDVNILRHICRIYSRAWRRGVLDPLQIRIANQAMDLLDALAGVGLGALVQEAVGWHRGDHLHSFNRYLLEIPSKYRPLFIKPYCELAFALHGKAYSHKHPKFFMNFVYLTVYRYVPGVIDEEAKRRNPVIDSKHRRRYKKFQYYSPEGKEALIHDQIIRTIGVGNQTKKKAEEERVTLVSLRPFFYKTLREQCEEQQIIEIAWEKGLQGKTDDQGTTGLPLFVHLSKETPHAS